jgi:hypothetical protein
MAVTRSKQASRYGAIDIYTTVGDWWQDVDVPYVAHAFLDNGVILRLRNVLRLPANNSAASHPDQQYWRTITQNGASRVQSIWNIVNPVRDNIIRIDIDCKLMPCATANTSCLYQVPAFINNLYGLNNVPLRMFSHADENMGGAGTSKRVVQCRSGVPGADLLAAYNDHDGWSWAP